VNRKLSPQRAPAEAATSSTMTWISRLMWGVAILMLALAAFFFHAARLSLIQHLLILNLKCYKVRQMNFWLAPAQQLPCRYLCHQHRLMPFHGQQIRYCYAG
jgi:hypothetical protein